MQQFLLDQTILVAQIKDPLIGDQPFDQLKEYAYGAIEEERPLGDRPNVSIDREYAMDVPPLFEHWLVDAIHKNFNQHKEVSGIYGVDASKLKIIKMWVNVMHQGDQHQPHMHNHSFYSFSAYIDVGNNDAPFFFIKDNLGTPVYINEDSIQHCLIFPSTLIHTVYPKESDGVRVSVSGNVIIDT